jgi:hypothetical protein
MNYEHEHKHEHEHEHEHERVYVHLMCVYCTVDVNFHVYAH